MSYLPQPRPTPWWMWLIIICFMLPGLSFPWVASAVTATNPIVRGLAWFYPVYVLCSGVLAWMSWRRGVTAVCWIILVLLAASHLCIFYLGALAL